MRPLLLLVALAGPLSAADPPALDVPLRRFGDDRFRVTGVVHASVLSPDGKRLAILSTCEQRRHAIVAILDADTGRPQVVSRSRYDGLGVFTGAEVCFSPDGKRVAVSLNPKTAFALDADTGREIWRAKDEIDALAPIAFDPTGRLLRTFTSESRAYDITSGRVVATFPVGGVDRFTPDGKTFVKANRVAGGITVGDLATGKVRLNLSEDAVSTGSETDRAYSGARSGLAVSHDGKTLATYAQHGVITLIDLASGRSTRTLDVPDSHRRAVSYAMSFSQDDGTLFFGAWYHPLLRWTTATGKALPTLEPPGQPSWRGAWASADGKAIVAANEWGLVWRWDAADGRLLSGNFDAHPRFELIPGGRTLITGNATGCLRITDIATGRIVQELPATKTRSGLANFVLSPDGRKVATITDSGRIEALTLSTQATVTLSKGEWTESKTLVWSRDSQSLFAGPLLSIDIGVRLHQFNTSTGGIVHTFDLPAIYSLTTDGAALIVRDERKDDRDSQFLRWDIQKKKIAGLLLHSNPIELLGAPDQFVTSSDPTVVALGCNNRIVLTGLSNVSFEATDSAPRILSTGFAGPVYFDNKVHALAFTPDAKWLVSGGDDCAVKVWEVATGRLVRRIDGQDDYVFRATVAPDGHTVFASTGDGFIRQWDLTPAFANVKAKPDELWKAAASRDPAVGVPAAWKLMSDVTLRTTVADKLPPVAKPDAAKVTAWVAQLDAAAFADREAATKELAALGRVIEKPLRDALRTTASAEVRERLEGLIAKFEKVYLPDELRAMRLVQAAEWFKLKEPLTVWAGGTPTAVLTRDAAAALARLK